MKTNNKTALLFIPETGIYPYARTLSILGNALQKTGYTVYITVCNGISLRCPMMPNTQAPFEISPEEKEKRCKVCNVAIDEIITNYNFIKINIKQSLTKILENKLNSLCESNSNLDEIMFDNIPIGKIAIYDFLLETKLLSVKNLTLEQEFLYKKYIKNTGLISQFAKDIINSINPNIVIGFNPYAQCQAISYVCKINNIIFKGITNQTHLGSNYSIIKPTNYLSMEDTYNHIQEYINVCDIPIDSAKVLECWNDVIFRMYGSGSHIFSSKKNSNALEVLKKLGIDSNKRVIGVFTSSLDERIGTDITMETWKCKLDRSEVFTSQIEWLKFIRKYALTQNEAIFVVRIHPREARNGGSEHLKLLKKEFSTSSMNFKIIWPEDNFSSYDLFEILTGCLISLSTMGLETQRLGIKTISYITNFSYPNERYISIPKNINEYSEALDLLIKDSKPQLFDFINSARFYNWITFINSIELGKTIKKDFNDIHFYPQVPETKIKQIVDSLENKIDLVHYNVALLKNANNSHQTEIDAHILGIKMCIEKLLNPPKRNNFTYFIFRLIRKFIFLMTKYEISYPFLKKTIRYKKHSYKIIISHDMKLKIKYKLLSLFNFNVKYFILSNSNIIYIQKGRIRKLYSPLITNLLSILEEKEYE